jgi:hypothetical protein
MCEFCLKHGAGRSRCLRRLPPVHAVVPVRRDELQCLEPEGQHRPEMVLWLWYLPVGLCEKRDPSPRTSQHSSRSKPLVKRPCADTHDRFVLDERTT